MNERELAITTLEDSGVLEAIRWASLSALNATRASHNPTDGNNRCTLGLSTHYCLANRFDRVFATGEFSLPPGAPPEAGREILMEGLTQEDRDSMPELPARLVVRNYSLKTPCWRSGNIQWLTQSASDGLNHIPWDRKGKAKRAVAAAAIPSLFGESEQDEPITTLVLAYMVDPDTRRYVLAIGSPLMNKGGGTPWVWREELTSTMVRGLTGSMPEGLRRLGDADVQSADAPVRLRPAEDDFKTS